MPADLIGSSIDEESLKGYLFGIIKITMNKVFSRQLISLRKLEDYMIVAAHLFESVILCVVLCHQ